MVFTTVVCAPGLVATSTGYTVQVNGGADVELTVAVRPNASVTVATSCAGFPGGVGVVGVPVISPPVVMANPAGRPLICQVAGPTPVLGCIVSCRDTALPTTAVCGPGSVTAGADGRSWLR